MVATTGTAAPDHRDQDHDDGDDDQQRHTPAPPIRAAG
jgi:hypothetical protein